MDGRLSGSAELTATLLPFDALGFAHSIALLCQLVLVSRACVFGLQDADNQHRNRKADNKYDHCKDETHHQWRKRAGAADLACDGNKHIRCDEPCSNRQHQRDENTDECTDG